MQVNMEACLPDMRVAPVKVTASSQQQAGYASPRRKIGGGSDAGPLHRSLKGLSRSKSARDPAEEVYEEFGSPVERAASRPSSRVKTRVAKDARAELLGLDEAHMHNVGHNRGLRSRSAARVREGVVDTEMDVDLCENYVASSHNDIISKARPPSRSKNRSLREDNGGTVTLQEALQQAAERDREVRASRTTKGGVDGPVEIDVRSYGGRSVGSTPRLSTRASTPRLTVRGSLQDHEDLGGGSLDVECEKELRSSSVDVARRSLISMDSMEDDVGQVERVVSYRTPTRSPRGVRESSDHLAEERVMRAERLTRKQQLRSPRKTKVEIVADMQVDTVMVHSERVYARRNVRKAEVDGPAADDDEEEDVQVNQRKSRVARQHKRKVREIPRDSATALPVSSSPPECEMPDVPLVEPVDPLPPSPTTSARSARGELVEW